MTAAWRTRWRTPASVLAVGLLAAAVPVAMRVADAAPPDSCSSGYAVDEVLANGARWQLCWERRDIEGIVLHDVTYTPPGGTPVMILAQANLAEIHVPYDNNAARFFDLSQIGLGWLDDPDDGFNGGMNDLTPADCPDGTLLQDGPADVLCLTEGPTGYAYKYYDESAQGTSLNLFSVTGLGQYNYVVAWNLDDDGTIRPEVGATGQLQLYGGPPGAGWPVGGGRRGVGHMHNYYWRLDFDIDGTRNDDRVQELAAVPVAGSGRQRFTNTRRAFTTEVARRVSPTSFRSWRIHDTVTRNTDGHLIGVELLPTTDHVYRGPAREGFTQRELYVTGYRSCERFVANNPVSGACRPAPRDQVPSFVNGESLAGRDLVVWYGASFHHLPRDEDEEHMHPHWTGFSIIPRDLTATNPVG